MKRIRVTAVSSRCARHFVLLLLVSTVADCSHPTTRSERLTFTGRQVTVINARGNIYAYAPAFGDLSNEFTLTEATQQPNAVQTAVATDSKTITVCARKRLRDMYGDEAWPFFYKILSTEKARARLCDRPPSAAVDYTVRVPKQAHLSLFTANGSIHATDVAQPVDARVRTGEIKIQIPSYANAATEEGNITVLFGDAQWPGTLHFSTERGDIEVWVPATADADVNLHTDHGTIFTDFNLRGTSSGDTETIAGSIGRGGNRKVDVHVTNGSIRMLKLTPQM